MQNKALFTSDLSGGVSLIGCPLLPFSWFRFNAAPLFVSVRPLSRSGRPLRVVPERNEAGSSRHVDFLGFVLFVVRGAGVVRRGVYFYRDYRFLGRSCGRLRVV